MPLACESIELAIDFVGLLPFLQDKFLYLDLRLRELLHVLLKLLNQLLILLFQLFDLVAKHNLVLLEL